MARIDRKVEGKKFEKWLADDFDVQFEIRDRAQDIAHRAEQLLIQERRETEAMEAADAAAATANQDPSKKAWTTPKGKPATIDVAFGDVDAYVVMEHESPKGKFALANSAMSIEFGRAGYVDQYGHEWGEMKGLAILQRAAHLHLKGAKAKRQRIKRWSTDSRKRGKKPWKKSIPTGGDD
jgi:hypothetical protein